MTNPSTSSISSSLHVIAIVGRPNVGKSTLFNRIIRRRVAIVHEEQGVTRDRIISTAEWDDKHFSLIDTGGLGMFENERITDQITQNVRDQLQVAVKDAQKVILVLDASTGILPLDHEIGKILRNNSKNVIVAVNKADNPSLSDSSFESLKLGFKSVIPISCVHNHNIRKLMDMVTKDIPVQLEDDILGKTIHLAIVGRPNVGKSTITNQFVHEERVIVSEVPGTTRDAIDVPITLKLEEELVTLNLIDTAGIRQSGKIKSAVDFFQSISDKGRHQASRYCFDRIRRHLPNNCNG